MTIKKTSGCFLAIVPNIFGPKNAIFLALIVPKLSQKPQNCIKNHQICLKNNKIVSKTTKIVSKTTKLTQQPMKFKNIGRVENRKKKL